MTEPVSRLPRVALIGVAGYGAIHLTELLRLHREGVIQLQAASVICPEEVPQACASLAEVGCRLYGDYQEMFKAEEGQLDYCCIPTGIAWHEPMTIAALEAGCHVLVEKPAAATVEAIDRMIRARDKAGKSVAVGFQYLSSTEFARLRRELLRGTIGDLYEIRVAASWPRDTTYYTRNNWAGRIQAEGRWILDSPANNALSHFLMVALQLAGPEGARPATPVWAEAELYRAQPIESFDTVALRTETDTGVTIRFAATHSADQRSMPVLELHGENGKIVWHPDHSTTLQQPDAESLDLYGAPRIPPVTEMFDRLFQAPSVPGRLMCSLEMARSHSLLINLLHRHVPITNIPDRYRVQQTKATGCQWAIQGIEEAIESCLSTGRLFSELGLPWATPYHRAFKPTDLPSSEVKQSQVAFASTLQEANAA